MPGHKPYRHYNLIKKQIVMISDLLKHLTFWHNKTDDECIEMATGEYGIDAERALMNILERDFCTQIGNNVIKELKNK
jgi:hypothetical protein